MMKKLEERIVQDGRVISSDILKVDSFLNHQIDPELMKEIGEEFYRLFKDEGITKILTIEASGIAIASFTAMAFHVPFVFAKKAKSLNIDGDVLTSTVKSFTYGKEYTITVAKKFITPDDRILIVDDFLANGMALNGLTDIIHQAGAVTAGIGICIEKGFQPGGEEIRRMGYHLESLAIIDKMDESGITFRN